MVDPRHLLFGQKISVARRYDMVATETHYVLWLYCPMPPGSVPAMVTLRI
jgi:hypothetical protein